MEYIEDIIQELHGPGRLRFIIQPVIALVLGIRDGKRDARDLRPAFFINLVMNHDQRSELWKDAFKTILKPLMLAWLMDTIFQFVILHHWNPSQAMIVGFVLVVIPYVLSRGLANRAISKRKYS
jgi:hypothetical protein